MNAIAENARARPDELALRDDRAALSWAQLHATVNRCANALLASGLSPGARIAVFAPNCVEAIIVYLAAMRAGISSAPLSFHLTAEETAPLLHAAHAELVFVGGETPSGLEGARLAGVKSVIGWRCAPDAVIESWDHWLAAASDTDPSDAMAPKPQLHFTSGTTGAPKAVETPPSMFPAAPDVRTLFAKLAEAARAPNIFAPALMVGPHYHTAGLRQMRLLAGGVPLVVLSKFDAERVLDLIARHKIGMTTMVPTHFQRLLALPAETRARYDLSSLRALFHTGAACPPSVKRAMIAWLGPILIEAYGGTECGTTTLITSTEWLERPGSVGKAAEPFEILILDESGATLPSSESGAVYFRDRTGRGLVYHGNPELTQAAHIAPGVFTLGEIGYLDADNYLFITDRASDMIVSGGVNIYPVEIEQVLMQHPEILDVAIVGAPNTEMGEEVKALVIPRNPGAPPSAEELNRFMRARIAGLKCPRSFEFVVDLGRNAMGKVNKRALRRPYWLSERTIG